MWEAVQLTPAEPAAAASKGRAWLESSLCVVRPVGFLDGNFQN